MKNLIILLFFLSPLSISAQIFDGDYFDCRIFETGTCVESKSVKTQASLFPNPTVDVLTVDVLNSQNTEGVIINTAGQWMKAVSFKQSYTFDVSELAQSIYFLKLLPSGIVLKFVKL
jgi:Secretion system C-terminal sorting domain